MDDLANVIRPGTKRGLDFVILEELRKRTGIMPSDVLKFAMAEMLCNALDTDATIIEVFLKDTPPYAELTVRDNGSKPLSLDDINLILDFSNKASSKRGFLRVSRGYLGNALKCIFGYSYALSIEKGMDPPSTIIESGGKRYTIDLKPDRTTETIKYNITDSDSESPLTMFTVRIPHVAEYVDIYALEDIIEATSMVNPDHEIRYDILGDGEAVVLGTADEDIAVPKRPTSILWYSLKQFESLFNDYLRVRPDMHLKDFIALFRTLYKKKPIRAVLHTLATALSHDAIAENNMQKGPSTPINDLGTKDITALYHSMREHTKPIGKRSIPSIGKARFESLCEDSGWNQVRYAKAAGFINIRPDAVSYPYLVELAVFYRDDDGEGLKRFSCVNFMASQEDVFSRMFSVRERVGRLTITEDRSITIVTHLVCPVLNWLSHGKSGLGWDSSISASMKKVFDKILPIPKTPRVHRPKLPPRPLKWMPRGKLGNWGYEERLKIVAAEIEYLESLRSDPIKYGSRDWCYLLEGIDKIDKGEFNVVQGGLANCRKAGFLPMDFFAPDKDESRHFKGIHGASNPRFELLQLKDDVKRLLEDIPSNTTDFWEGEEYYLLMVVEKASLVRLFRPVCNEYHVPIVSAGGSSPVAVRGHVAQLGKMAEEIGLKPVALLFYDHDPWGMKFSDTFKEKLDEMKRGTKWDPYKLEVYRFGLNKEDIDKHSLMWIENLKSGSGKEANAETPFIARYLAEFGRRKCEANALFRTDETLAVGRQICRSAIEKYYGEDALVRFKKKEEAAREKMSDIYTDPMWDQFNEGIDRIRETLFESAKNIPPPRAVPSLVKETAVFINKDAFARCPECGRQFFESMSDDGKLVSCPNCFLPIRLRLKESKACEGMKGVDP